ncbi:MAG: C40 family peptidase [Synechococcales bacterium]|nr:C40 family peptidase [Synechococcales bacterium]
MVEPIGELILEQQSPGLMGSNPWPNHQTDREFVCQADLDVYDSPALERLATQAIAGRQLRILTSSPVSDGMTSPAAIPIRLCEDGYPGWIPAAAWDALAVAEAPYRAMVLDAGAIAPLLPDVIAYTQRAMQQPNHYLWGGTIGPNFDCSGLMQAAFRSVGVWIPRDAYQQAAFVQPVAMASLQPGDLIFFGTPERITHVGLSLGDGRYIHSSGKAMGRNGIGIDRLSGEGDRVSQAYYQQLRGAGRVVCSYQPPIDE